MIFKNNVKENYFLTFIIIFYFFLNLYQLNIQHWSSMMDHDFYILYNSLLISSGIEQEGRDHPALITFFLHGLIFKIIGLFQNNFTNNLDDILNSSKINETFQFFFEVSRQINFFINLFLFLAFYKLLEVLKLNYKTIFLASLIFLFSNWFVLSFFALRSENLSLFFVILTLIYINLDSRINLNNYFIAGIFFGFAMMTKIQIVFFFLYIIFFIGIHHNQNNMIIKKFFLSKIDLKYFLYSLFFLLILYACFQLKIQEFPRFEKNKYLDLFIFLISLISFYIFFLIIAKFKKNIIREKIVLTSIFLHGFLTCLFLIVVLDLFQILPVNDYIYLRITNPIHYMSEFQALYANGNINLKFLFLTISSIIKSYNQSLVELILLLTIITFTIKKYYASDKDKIYSIIILFFIFIIISTINSFRGYVQYHLYYTFCYLLVLSTCQNYLNTKLSKSFIFFIILIFLINNNLANEFVLKKGDEYSKIFDRKISIMDTCNEFRHQIKAKQADATVAYLKYWHNKFDDKKINSLCNELGI